MLPNPIHTYVCIRTSSTEPNPYTFDIVRDGNTHMFDITISGDIDIKGIMIRPANENMEIKWMNIDSSFQ